MTDLTAPYYLVTWMTPHGRTVEMHETEEAALRDYRAPFKGWHYLHAMLVSHRADGWHGDEINLPALSESWTDPDEETGLSEWEQGMISYAAGGGYR